MLVCIKCGRRMSSARELYLKKRGVDLSKFECRQCKHGNNGVIKRPKDTAADSSYNYSYKEISLITTSKRRTKPCYLCKRSPVRTYLPL